MESFFFLAYSRYFITEFSSLPTTRSRARVRDSQYSLLDSFLRCCIGIDLSLDDESFKAFEGRLVSVLLLNPVCDVSLDIRENLERAQTFLSQILTVLVEQGGVASPHHDNGAENQDRRCVQAEGVAKFEDLFHGCECCSSQASSAFIEALHSASVWRVSSRFLTRSPTVSPSRGGARKYDTSSAGGSNGTSFGSVTTVGGAAAQEIKNGRTKAGMKHRALTGKHLPLGAAGSFPEFANIPVSRGQQPGHPSLLGTKFRNDAIAGLRSPQGGLETRLGNPAGGHRGVEARRHDEERSSRRGDENRDSTDCKETQVNHGGTYT